MLNSVYGRFGIKEITSQIKVVKNKDYSEKMNKKMNHVVLTELSNGDKIIIKSAGANSNLLNLNLNDIVNISKGIEVYEI